jgi:ketosteroid isomerase-like protein
MSPEENKALVRRFYEAIDAGDLAAMDDLVAEDYVNHHPPPLRASPGPRGAQAGIRDLLGWSATDELGLLVQLGVVSLPQA